MKTKSDIIQKKNPKTGSYVKIDRTKGKILGHSKKPFKGIKLLK